MSHAETTLPWLGLGLAANADGRSPPHPYRLLEQTPGAFDFVEYSAPLSLEEARREAPMLEEIFARARSGEVPALFHPVHLNLWGPEVEPESARAALSEHLLASRSPWVSNDVAWWHRGGQPFPGYQYLAPPFSEEGLAQCVHHALTLARQSPVPLLLENPAVIARRGPMHVADFMTRLAEETGLDLLLDLGHLLSFQLSAGLPLEASLERFPWHRVVEIHIAGGVTRRVGARTFYADDHTQPVPEPLFTLLESALPRCTRLRAVTYEADGHPISLARLTLERLRTLIPKQLRPPISAAAPKALQRPASLDSAWTVFDETHGRTPAEDAEGAREELDFRLAVLAQTLDRAWPLTRLLAAGTREQLAAFAASDDYKAQFTDAGRQLDQAFSGWARRASLQRRDEESAAVIAFESWAHATVDQAARRGEGEIVATFPMDLTELLLGAASMRRHALGRAWTCSLEVDAEAPRALVRRAPRRSWKVRLSRRDGALELALP